MNNKQQYNVYAHKMCVCLILHMEYDEMERKRTNGFGSLCSGVPRHTDDYNHLNKS